MTLPPTVQGATHLFVSQTENQLTGCVPLRQESLVLHRLAGSSVQQIARICPSATPGFPTISRQAQEDLSPLYKEAVPCGNFRAQDKPFHWNLKPWRQNLAFHH